MSSLCFVDTNVLFYSIDTLSNNQQKTRIAQSLLDEMEIGLSVKVLQEFYVQATRPTRKLPLSHEEATRLIRSWSRHTVQNMTLAVMNHAFEIKHRYQLSDWDGAIIAAATALGCDTLMSEDIQHGQQFGHVRVVNPL